MNGSKKFQELKSWLTLDEVATRLSSLLKNEVSINDILQLALEGEIRLSWYARHIPAISVAEACFLCWENDEVLQERLRDGDFYGPVHWDGEIAFRAHEATKQLEPFACRDYVPRAGEPKVKLLNGIFELEIDESEELRDWILALITNTDGDLVGNKPAMVSDAQGFLWEILEHQYGPRFGAAERDAIDWQFLNSRGPSFPKKSELVIKREELDAFEDRLSVQNGSQERPVLTRERTSYLRIIASLLDVIQKGISSSRNDNQQIGPAKSGLKDAELIEALVSLYGEYEGISKSGLEEKFANAKRSLKP